jgi:HK97 gp10 family phage protein
MRLRSNQILPVKWYSTQQEVRIRNAADRGARKAATILKNELVRLIVETPKSGRITSIKYGRRLKSGNRVIKSIKRASAPGEPPASQSGKLLRSIQIVTSRITGVLVRISAPHARWLERGTKKMEPRPFIRPAIANKKIEMKEAMAQPIRELYAGKRK